MNSVDKFRSYRQRRSERLARRAFQSHAAANPHTAARQEMLFYVNRVM